MNKKTIENIIHIRHAVSFLGEKKGWWNTNFFKESSGEFLKYIFPRSNGGIDYFAIHPIKHSIDEIVGANYYHLFRLPSTIEETINKSFSKEQYQIIETEVNAVEVLESIGSNFLINKNEGPKNIGSISELDENLIQVFAAEYLSAFKNNYTVHPYLN